MQVCCYVLVHNLWGILCLAIPVRNSIMLPLYSYKHMPALHMHSAIVLMNLSSCLFLSFRFCLDVLEPTRPYMLVCCLGHTSDPNLSLLDMSRAASHTACATGLQVDFLMSGLIVLKERVDATEALIAIDLDNRRNDLVAFDLVQPVLPRPAPPMTGAPCAVSSLHVTPLCCRVGHHPQRARHAAHSVCTTGPRFCRQLNGLLVLLLTVAVTPASSHVDCPKACAKRVGHVDSTVQYCC